MATIAFQMTSTPLTGSKSFTGTDQDMSDLLAWATVVYAPLIQQLFNPTNTPGFVPTNTQIGVALATGTVNAWKNAVVKFKKDAVIAAVPEPNPSTWA